VPEPHRISYVGDPSLVGAFIRLLNDQGVGTDEEPLSIAEQMRRDSAQAELLSILASGGYGVTANAIASAIGKFADRFPGRAQIHDDGRLPTHHQLSYTGNPALVEAFIDMLAGEELGVDEPDEDDDWPSVSEQLAQTSGEATPISILTGGWGDINVGIGPRSASSTTASPARQRSRTKTKSRDRRLALLRLVNAWSRRRYVRSCRIHALL
jgi:hypothetical protein